MISNNYIDSQLRVSRLKDSIRAVEKLDGTETGSSFLNKIDSRKGHKRAYWTIEKCIEKGRVDNYKETGWPTNKNFDAYVAPELVGIKKLENYIDEYPMPIENRYLWEDLCDDAEFRRYEKYQREVVRKTNGAYFDYYFPQLKLALELDGQQHSYRSTWDKIRDEYFETMYGIKTLRYTGFGYSDPDLVIPCARKVVEDLKREASQSKGKKKFEITAAGFFRACHSECMYIIENYIIPDEYNAPDRLLIYTAINGIQEDYFKWYATQRNEEIQRIIRILFPNTQILKF